MVDLGVVVGDPEHSIAGLPICDFTPLKIKIIVLIDDAGMYWCGAGDSTCHLRARVVVVVEGWVGLS